MAHRIGVDLGGTKIEGIALAEDGAVVVRRRIPTPAGDYTATVEAVGALVDGIELDAGPGCTVGVATPGAISCRTGLIKNANSTVLNGRPLQRDLGARLARDVRLSNDANCFALSEATDGAAAGNAVVFGVILGTGVGGGLVVRGGVVEGRNAIAGEWGHNPLPWARADELPGPRCYCGKRGCIETFLSGPALAASFRARTGRERTAQEIGEDAACGESDALATLADYEDRLARALAHVVNIVDPDAIVLGGGVSNVARLYASVAALLPRHVFSDAVETPVLRAVHGDSSGVRGAAWLWPPAE